MTRRRKVNEGAQAVATKLMATVEEDEAKMIAAIDVEGMKDGADDPDANKHGSDGDGNGDGDGDGDNDGNGGGMLVNELVCILLMQEFLGCSWQIAQGGIVGGMRSGQSQCSYSSVDLR
jgi:hypothetical protein